MSGEVRDGTNKPNHERTSNFGRSAACARGGIPGNEGAGCKLVTPSARPRPDLINNCCAVTESTILATRTALTSAGAGVQMGRATCRGTACQYGWTSGMAVNIK